MAGTSPDFDGDDFRDVMRGVGGVFEIFAPPDAEARATFLFPKVIVYDAGVDEDDVPFDRNALPVTAHQPNPVQAPCAVEYFDAAGQPTSFGDLIPSRAEITLMDVDYHLIDGSEPGTVHFDYVLLNGERFKYKHTEYPTGLFDVGIYVVHVQAENAR